MRSDGTAVRCVYRHAEESPFPEHTDIITVRIRLFPVFSCRCRHIRQRLAVQEIDAPLSVETDTRI